MKRYYWKIAAIAAGVAMLAAATVVLLQPKQTTLLPFLGASSSSTPDVSIYYSGNGTLDANHVFIAAISGLRRY